MRFDSVSDAMSAFGETPLPRHRLSFGFWLVASGSWVLLALTATLQFALAEQAGFSRAFSFTAFQWLPWAVLTPLITKLSFRFPLERATFRRTIWPHLVVCLGVMAGLGVLGYWAGPPPFRELEDRPLRFVPLGPRDLTHRFLIRTTFQLPAYWAIVGVVHAFIFYQRVIDRDRRAVELESQLAQSRLRALQMQINPHFLFNTLNSIASLVHENPQQADEMITALSDLLRRTLSTADRTTCTLKEELELLAGYLAIEQTRFGERLKIEKQIETPALDALVPILILQPLVENAIKHGIQGRLSPGLSRLTARREGDWLKLKMVDNGKGLAPEAPLREGVGLRTTRARLRDIPGSTLTLHAPEGGGFAAEVRLPWRTADTQS